MTAADRLDAIEAAAVTALMARIEPKEHGQLCPVWTHRTRATIPPCNCWQHPAAIRTARAALPAAFRELAAFLGEELDAGHIDPRRRDGVRQVRRLLTLIADAPQPTIRTRKDTRS